MTPEEREEIRSNVDLASLVGDDVELRRRGDKLWTCCPFHEEKTPSFMIDESDQHFHCFSCGAHGDVFDYVMQTRGMTFPEAAELLATRAGIELDRHGAHAKGPSKARMSAAIAKAALIARQLLEDKDRPDAARARSWLEEHGIGSEARDRWNLGLLPGGNVLTRALQKAGYTESELRIAGVSNGRVDSLYHVICVPVPGAEGRPVGIAAQTLTVRPRAFATRTLRQSTFGTKEHGHPEPFTYKALFGLPQAAEAIRATGEAIVTLTPVEAIALHEAGTKSAVSSLGGGLFERQAKTLVANGARTITLAYPSDGVGTLAALASTPAAMELAATIRWAPADNGHATHTGPGSELVEAVVKRHASKENPQTPSQLVNSISKVCANLRIAADEDSAKAAILAELVADAFGVRDHHALMGPLIDGSPIGSSAWRERLQSPVPDTLDAPLVATTLTVARERSRHPHHLAHRPQREDNRHRAGNVGESPLQHTHTQSDEQEAIMGDTNAIETHYIDTAPRTKLATPEEISLMSDLQALAKVDELRQAAREAAADGHPQEAFTLYANACDVAENNLVCVDVIAEYADALEEHGHHGLSGEYHEWHDNLTNAMADYGLPFPGYEDRLRAEAAQASQAPQGIQAPQSEGKRERLADAASHARAAAALASGQPPTRGHLPSREAPQP